MEIILKKHETMLLELLRSALHNIPANPSVFKDLTEEDWKSCYHLAVNQGVMALAWDGSLTLPQALMPPRRIKIMWALKVEEYERRYKRYCQTSINLSQFYAKHGIRTVVLKGVGFSTYYPIPKHREGGDIDIYTYSADPSKMSDEEASELADQLIKKSGKEVKFDFYKHSSFTYEGIMIENHKFFQAITDFRFAAMTEPFLQSSLQPEELELLEGQHKILVPSEAFNTIFIASHAIQHYSRGLCLHHLCDWACVLKHNGLHLPEDIKDKRYIEVVHALTAFCNKYLGTQVPADCREAKLNQLFIEVMRSPYQEHFPTSNPIAIFIYRVQRLIRYRIALKQFIGEPILAGCWGVFRRRIRKPSTMFRKEK